MSKRGISAIGILVATVTLTLFLEGEPAEPDPTDAKHSHSYARRIPMQLGQWKGEELPVGKRTAELVGTDDLLMRGYVNDRGESVVFAAVFAKDNRRAAHPPEICYRGQGWDVEQQADRRYAVRPPAGGYKAPPEGNGEGSPQELEPLTSFGNPIDFTFMELVIRKRGTGELQVVHYWYKTGRRSTNSLLLHEWHMFINNVLLRGSTNSLLRVSTRASSPSEEDIQAARERVQSFCKIVFPYTIAALP